MNKRWVRIFFYAEGTPVDQHAIERQIDDAAESLKAEPVGVQVTPVVLPSGQLYVVWTVTFEENV